MAPLSHTVSPAPLARLRCRSCRDELTLTEAVEVAAAEIAIFTASHRRCPGSRFELLLPITPRRPVAC
jgi:hypothetical protein